MPSTTFIDLSRVQFATTAAFHMTFPALTVGLAIFLVICYGAYYRTGNPLYLQMFRFWRKIFTISFALGIVAGIVFTFELGLNWGNYSSPHRNGPRGIAVALAGRRPVPPSWNASFSRWRA